MWSLRAQGTFPISTARRSLRRLCGSSWKCDTAGSVKRPHDIAEQLIDAHPARQESLLDGEIDDDLKRTAVSLDAEAKRIELRYAGLRKRRRFGLPKHAIDFPHHVR